MNLGANVFTGFTVVLRLSGKPLILKLCGRLDLGFEQIKTQQLYGRYYEDIPRRVPDIRKTETILHWKPKVRAKDGIRKTIEWAKENINLHQ